MPEPLKPIATIDEKAARALAEQLARHPYLNSSVDKNTITALLTKTIPNDAYFETQVHPNSFAVKRLETDQSLVIDYLLQNQKAEPHDFPIAERIANGLLWISRTYSSKEWLASIRSNIYLRNHLKHSQKQGYGYSLLAELVTPTARGKEYVRPILIVPRFENHPAVIRWENEEAYTRKPSGTNASRRN